MADQVQMPNILGTLMGVRGAYQDEQQQAQQNQLAQRRMQMQEAEFQAQQQERARQEQFNQLAGQFLGQSTVEMAGGLQPGAQPQPGNAPMAPGPPPNALGQLYALDPARAMQMQQFQLQQAQLKKAQDVERLSKVHNLTQQVNLAGERAPTMARYLLSSDKIGDLDVKGMRAALEGKHGMPIAEIPDAALLQDIQLIGAEAAAGAGIGMGEGYSLSQGQTRFDALNRPVASVGKPGSGASDAFAKVNPSDYTPESVAKFEKSGVFADLKVRTKPGEDQTFTRANVFRDEFNSLNKEYSTVKASYETIKALAREPSAAGDIGLTIGFMRLNDPASTVREGEVATATNAAGVPERVRAQYNKLLSGEALTPAQRSDFVKQSGNIFKSRETQYNQTRKKYSTLAKRAGVDPIDVVGEEEAPPDSPSASPDITALLNKYAPQK